MVIPLPNSAGAPLAGPPSEELAPVFEKITVSVWVMMCSGAVRLLLGALSYGFGFMLLNSMNLTINILVGIFLLRDNPTFANIHQCLMTTVFQMCNQDQGCPGSMACLLPFVVTNFLTVAMDVLFPSKLFDLVTAGQGQLFDKQAWGNDPGSQFKHLLFTMAFYVALVSQLCAAVWGWKAYQQATEAQGGITSTPGTWGRDRPGGDGDRLGGYNPPAYRPAAPSGGSSRSPGWQPFSGTGQTLGTSR